MRRWMTTARAVGTAVVLVAVLAGCSLLNGSTGGLPAPSRTPSASSSAGAGPTPTGTATGDLVAESAHPRTPTPAPTEASAPAPTLTPFAAGTPLVEVDVTSPKGSVHFHLRVVADGDDTFTAQYSGFTSTLPVPVGVTMLDIAPSVGDGLTSHGIGDHTLGGATSTPAAPSTAPMDGSGVDPSHLVALVLYSAATSDAGIPVELGPQKVLAVTKLGWVVPARQTNVHPVDGGSRANANGQVTGTTASGAPRAYRVAADDLIGDVAARFGISVRALVWLNEGVQVFGDQQYLYVGTTLNLDPTARP